MTRQTRIGLFAVSAAGLAALLLWAVAGLPDFGHYRGPLGDIYNRLSVPRTSSTDVVTTVNFDFRGFDTLGEEFILFASVVGVASLLRRLRDERERDPDDDAVGRHVPDTSMAIRAVGLGLVAPSVLIGIYVVSHGHQTPGGGFQGGVILATALLLTYLAGDYLTMRKVGPVAVIEAGEGAGASGFALLAVAGLVFAGSFFENWLPVGIPGQLLSSGTIPLDNAAVGLAVAGGFCFMLIEFLQQTLVRRRHSDAARRVRP